MEWEVRLGGLARERLAVDCFTTHALKSEATPSSTCGLVAMTSASHAEGRQLDPGQV